MKKLLLISMIALQGASMFAMRYNNDQLSGKARDCYCKIMSERNSIKPEVLAEMLEVYPDLPNWKLKKGSPLLFCFIQANNLEAVRFLIDNGADTSVVFKGKTAKMHALGKKPILALLEEARNGNNNANDNQSVEEIDMGLPQEFEDMLNDGKSQGGILRYATPKSGLMVIGLTLLGTYAYKRYTGKTETK